MRVLASRTVRRAPLARAALAVALLALLAPTSAGAAVRWGGCPVGEAPSCAMVRVPLDRSGAVPGSIPLHVARLRGDGRRPTLVYLSGGPGGAGVFEASFLVGDLGRLLEPFTVIAYDQRGTGRSGLLRCPALEADPRLRSPGAAEACARRLGPARSFYRTADSVEDLEALRAALGVARLTLLAASYGTQLALAYARAHPRRVERLLLDSVVDPGREDPFALDTWQAMGPSLAALCPRGCRGVTRTPAADLATLAARLRARPLGGPRVRWALAADPRPDGLTALDLADLMFDSDYDPRLRAALPAAVRSVLRYGNPAPLLRLKAAAAPLGDLPGPRLFSAGRYAAVCEEERLPWQPGTPLEARAGAAEARAAALGAGAFGPFSFAEARADLVDLCLRWPNPGIPARAPAPGGHPAVPTLLLQGGEDLRTPPAGSARVARRVPGAQRVLVPGVGHAVLAADPSGCGRHQLGRFLRGATVRNCPRVPTGLPPAPVLPARLAQLAPASGVPGLAGRTLAAVGLTLADVRVAGALRWDPGLPGDGLRGGSFRVGREEVVLHGVRVVPGVRVSGTGRRGAGWRLRVDGARVASGFVRVGLDGRVRGRLGGRTVSGRITGGARLP